MKHRIVLEGNLCDYLDPTPLIKVTVSIDNSLVSIQIKVSVLRAFPSIANNRSKVKREEKASLRAFAR